MFLGVDKYRLEQRSSSGGEAALNDCTTLPAQILVTVFFLGLTFFYVSRD